MLILTPWILGGATHFTLVTICVLGCVNILLLRKANLTKNKFPLIGIALLTAYVIIQYLNPSFEQVWIKGLRIWELENLENISFLPSSIKSNTIVASPAGFIILYSGVSLFAISLFTNQQPLRKVHYSIIFANFFLMAAAGLLFRVLDLPPIFGILEDNEYGVNSFFGTFIYKNHAAAFLNLGLSSILAFSLKKQHSNQSNKHDYSGEQTLLLFLAVFIFWAVIFSRSRFGFLCSSLIVFIYLILSFKYSFTIGKNKIAYGISAIAIVLGAIWGGYALSSSKYAAHLEQLDQNTIAEDRSFNQRMIAYNAELDMLSKRWMLGWGAGSFRYGFKIFQDHENEFDKVATPREQRIQLTYNWQHAHNDYLEFIIELGIIGTILLFSIPGYFFWIILRSNTWKEPFVLILLGGLGSTMLHALVDFPFRNPAVLLTWFTILVITANYCNKRRIASS